MHAKTLSTALLVSSLVGCSEEPSSPEADAIRDRLEAEDYRQSYARAPGWEMPRTPTAGQPHGWFIDIYVNDVVQQAIDSGEALDRWPDESLIVKDGWDEDAETLLFLAFMQRRPEGWFWGEYRGDGSLVAAGVDDPKCAPCHSAGQDSVLTFELPTGE